MQILNLIKMDIITKVEMLFKICISLWLIKNISNIDRNVNICCVEFL